MSTSRLFIFPNAEKDRLFGCVCFVAGFRVATSFKLRRKIIITLCSLSLLRIPRVMSIGILPVGHHFPMAARAAVTPHIV